MSTTTSATNEAKKPLASFADKDGHFRRQVSSFRDSIKVGGDFPPEKGRYLLYVSLACPWAHRTLIVRKLKGLEDFIVIATVHPSLTALGWSFYPPARGEDGEYTETTGEVGNDDGLKDVTGDPIYGSKFIRELYFKAEKEYSGRFTVPVLWDKKKETIVNNESAEIIRMLNSEFNSELSGDAAKLDLYPSKLQSEIDELNEWVYDTVLNGVYKTGFATTQAAYESNVVPLFKSLDRLEAILDGGKDFLVGGQLTEADVRLYTCLIRFDPVYHYHFKCNLGSIRGNYPNLNRWLKNLYHNNSAFRDTTSFEHIKKGYYTSMAQMNATRIVPVGPIPNIEPL